MTPAAQTPAVVYLRASTAKQGDSGLGLEAQEATCREECERRSWSVERVITEVKSTGMTRPKFWEAAALASNINGVVVVAKDDRASRSTLETLTIHDRAQKEGWHFFSCNMPTVDTTTAEGRFMATIFAAFAELERARIRQRTRDAMRAKIARGEYVGRPRTMPESTIATLRELRASGMSYQEMSDALNEQGIPGSQGGRWHKQSVHQAAKRYEITPTTNRST